jgi:hypothetical protein
MPKKTPTVATATALRETRWSRNTKSYLVTALIVEAPDRPSSSCRTRTLCAVFRKRECRALVAFSQAVLLGDSRSSANGLGCGTGRRNSAAGLSSTALGKPSSRNPSYFVASATTAAVRAIVGILLYVDGRSSWYLRSERKRVLVAGLIEKLERKLEKQHRADLTHIDGRAASSLTTVPRCTPPISNQRL